MSINTSPSHIPEENYLQEAHFKVEINEKMKVPDKISFNPNSNGMNQTPWQRDNFAMNVPERILVVGQNQHYGTRAPPREIVYDNSILPTEPYHREVRVGTPPRTLTLDKYPFPGVDDEPDEPEEEEVIEDRLPVASFKPKKNRRQLNDSDFNISFRESTPPIGGIHDRLTPAEEVLHLRKQMAKLNRRVMALELENMNRLQKEKFILGFGVAYLLLKVIIWMNRD